ncbi:MAG: D-sedoheptulose 7-phosphate isomerase [bacterium]
MSHYDDMVRARLLKTCESVDRFLTDRAGELSAFVELVADTYRSGGKVLVFGNGGSAAEAQHIAAELVNRMLVDRAPLAAIALTTDTSVMTSIGNDYSFEQVFARQVKALGQAGDLAWGLSTSGTSPNVNVALQAAREKGMKCAAMAGRPGSPISDLCDVCMWVDAETTPLIQEVHLAAAHVVCELVEKELFPEG